MKDLTDIPALMQDIGTRARAEAIEQIDVDALSPREALDTLYALQTTARETDA